MNPTILALALWPLSGCAPEDPAPHDDGTIPLTARYAPVPAGTFQMGCTRGQSDCDADETEHIVTLTHAYEVGVTEVTQWQFETTMGYNPSFQPDCGVNCPVESALWSGGAAYANALSTAAGLPECYACTGAGDGVACEVAANPYECGGYHLLTEAEWENAARCGADPLYSGSGDILDLGWISDNSDGRKHDVASLAPNACGLYDMSGNVWEWTQDWYDEYALPVETDPTGASSGSHHVSRGGAWDRSASLARVSYRRAAPGMSDHGVLGFRVGRSTDIESDL